MGDAEFSSPKRLLAERGLRPRKRLGQNFLVDPRFAKRIAAALPAGASVVEIGGGTGALTAALADVARDVEVLEVDRGLAAILRERFSGNAAVRVNETDALTFDFNEALRHEPPPRAICGNLPYSITTPLIERIIVCRDVWDACVIMVQREYGRRLAARPGTPDYSSLTIFVSYHCSVEHLFDAGAAGFYPEPAVASTVIRLTPVPESAPRARDEALLHWLIRASFAHRRKTLVNSAAGRLTASQPHARIDFENALCSVGLSANVRGERLSLADFVRLADTLAAQGFRAPRPN